MITTKPTFDEEKKLWEKGYCVIGIDEVGRGAFAGPLIVGAVVFDKENPLLSEINDSKLLKPLKRNELSKIIEQCSFCSTVASIPVSTINKLGIGKANQMAFRKVISQIRKIINHEKLFVLVDGFHVKYLRGIGLKNQKAIIKGDQKSVSIAAASIIAKVHRDRLMRSLSKKYPVYKFGKNKGYGTKDHQEAIKRFGLCKLHRKSFNLQKFTVSGSRVDTTYS